MTKKSFQNEITGSTAMILKFYAKKGAKKYKIYLE